jgi:AcrR family transcriptional regulator
MIMGAKERREKEKEQRKKQILDTAKTLLLEKGLNATSINQIAKLSELSVGAIYFYFKDKEDLYAALQVEGLDLLSEAISRAVDGPWTPEDKIRNIALAYLRFSEEYKSYFDIINYFLILPKTIFSLDLKSQIDERGNDSISILTEAFREGIETGLFKKVAPRRQAIILWSALHGMIQLKKLEITILAKDNHQSLYMELVERFLDGLRHGQPARRK